MFLEKAKKNLQSINPLIERNFIPCTQEEINLLEQYVQKPLPLAFKELLAWMGKGPRRIMPGEVFFYSYWMPTSNELDLLEEAKELLEENNLVPRELDQAFILLFHQGYYFEYFFLNQGDDPSVYSYMEGGDIRKIAESLSQYVEYRIIEKGCQLPKSLIIHSEEELINHHSFDHLITHISFNGSLKNGKFPKKVFDFVNLENLDLRFFKLPRIPKQINRFKSLKILNLNSNALKSLPDELFELQQLETLYISTNRLATIPESIKKLKKLKTLTVNGNYLSPQEIEMLESRLPETDILSSNQKPPDFWSKIIS